MPADPHDQPSARPLVLAFGDSLTAGYGLARGEAFPARLEALLKQDHPEARVLNAGVSGDTTTSALARLPGVLSRLEHRPDLAIVELGANDLLRGIPPARSTANLDAILRELERCTIAVLLASMDPPAILGAIGAGYTGIHARLAERHRVPIHPFFPPGVLGHPAYVLGDRMHPNAAAIERVAQAMLPIVRELVGRSQPN
jgi:acyl-CoA thioesterase-1